MSQSAELLLDLGNTRGKWRWQSADAPAQHGDFTTLDEARAQWQALPAATALYGCAVGSPDLQNALASLAHELWGARSHWLATRGPALGLTHAYQSGQLGSDRWAAALGAWASHGPGSLLCVSAGTACVIDAVSRSGVLLGGHILPGYRLQREALHRHTARLPLASGQWARFPDNTHDAIASGCLLALASAIGHAADSLAQHDGQAPQILLSGGDAALIAPQLNSTVKLVDNLPLLGLAALRHAQQGVFE